MDEVDVDALGKTMNPDYKLYHPRWHRERIPIFWWLGKFSYTKFITRELTSLAVGYSAVLLIVELEMMSRGPEAYARFQSLLSSPLVLTFHVVVIAFLLIHTVTWLNLAPKALVLKIGHRRIPASWILAGHYLGWIAASAIVIWFLAGR